MPNTFIDLSHALQTMIVKIIAAAAIEETIK